MGSVAQFVFSEGKTGSTDQVRWSWGLGVAFGVYVAGGVSGKSLSQHYVDLHYDGFV